MGIVCISNYSICCRSKNNVIYRELYIDDEDYKTKDKMKKIILIQSVMRRFLVKKRYSSHNLFQIKEISMDYNTNSFENNTIIQKLNQLLPKFELTEKESYEMNNSSNRLVSLLYPNNSIYKGMINDQGLKEGFGKYFLSDGTIYKGFFHNDKMEGRGRLININGFIYEGEFKSGLCNGYGKYISLDGTCYKGMWFNNKQNGIGEETYCDNSNYNGFFKDGKKSGFGKLTFCDQNLYEGNFENNEINGEGAYYWKDGRIYIGSWIDNKMNGYGIFFWPDKKKYYGEYKDNLKEGFGIFQWVDGQRYEGFWKNGRQHGYGVMINGSECRYAEWDAGKIVRKIEDNKTIELINKEIEKIQKQKNYVDFTLNIEKYEKKITDGSSSQETGHGSIFLSQKYSRYIK